MDIQDMGLLNLTIKVSKAEADALKAYCESKQRTQSDVLRGFIWSIMTDADRRKLASEKEPLLPTTVQFLRSTVIVKDDDYV